MSSREPPFAEPWRIVWAGEYVLGTLRGRDLDLFERALHHDRATGREVDRWAHWFAVLNEGAARREPGQQVWPGILNRIRDQHRLTTA